ncbi:uncharacterized protein BXZ73DRAFT_74246 [Epithele typhae]|uniref:uncharacterized protein n=1 Tax=Epithele typhae TaxID=378194 RepID=UPI002008D246|nr:uncharacterized protein BXZ73DRAFT_74246 [Epithele typhae]KAH9943251.1 hypothetical protein BXZ73DRAFT_74246 [Epithele typhae]
MPDDPAQHREALTTLGIKVRDFFHESNLPPVPVVKRYAVQTQPGPRHPVPLRRTGGYANGIKLDRPGLEREESEDELHPDAVRTWYIDSNGTGATPAGRWRKKVPQTLNLERTLTEPIDDNDVPDERPLHDRTLPYPSTFPSGDGHASAPQPYTLPRQRPVRGSPLLALSPNAIPPSQQSQPSLQPDTQDTDMWVDTPLVTPNGSFQWPDGQHPELPLSQIDSVLPQLCNLDRPGSQVATQGLGFSPERPQQPAPLARQASTYPAAAGLSSMRLPQPLQMPPMSVFGGPTPTSPSVSPPPTSPEKGSDRGSSSPSSVGKRSHDDDDSDMTPVEAAPQTRYHFRSRAPPPPPLPSSHGKSTRASARSSSRGHHTAGNGTAPQKKKQKVATAEKPPSPSKPRSTRGRRANGE